MDGHKEISSIHNILDSIMLEAGIDRNKPRPAKLFVGKKIYEKLQSIPSQSVVNMLGDGLNGLPVYVCEEIPDDSDEIIPVDQFGNTMDSL